MVSVMWDAMLRVSEDAALIWSDLAMEVDGTGRRLIRRSKTDAEGKGVVAFVSAPTMGALDSIRNRAAADEGVIGLRPTQIAKCIKRDVKSFRDRQSGSNEESAYCELGVVGLFRALAGAEGVCACESYTCSRSHLWVG